jgi:hypothetical protein
VKSLLVVLALVTCVAAAPTPAPTVFNETEVAVPASFGTLHGSLTMPTATGTVPIVVIIAGSGPVDRNGNALPIEHSDAYTKLAQALAARGIATLRYDKRGIGASVTTQPETALRFDDYVTDVQALVDYLHKDARFSSISLVGHSEGSLIGMLAAQRDPNVAKYISVSGPGRSLGAIIDSQVRANNTPPYIVSEVIAIDASLAKGQLVPSPDPQLNALFRPSVQPYLISEYRYDPSVEIAKVTQPTLIVQGTTDIQIGVDDAHRLAKAKPNAKLAIIDGMNHILVQAPADRAGNMATYVDPSLPIDPTLVSTIADFVLAPA